METMNRQIRALTLCVFVVAASSGARAGSLDNAWLKGVTDKDPLSYGLGEEIVFTLTPVGIEGDIPEGKYRLKWTRSDDCGNFASGTVPFVNEPFIYKTQIDKPGFVRLEAVVIGQDGTPVVKNFTGDVTTPEGRRAMNRFEKAPKQIFFDGGAGVCVDKLSAPEEPDDFDSFWKGQFGRLDKVPIKADKIEIACSNPKARLYAVRVDCAGLRPVTGYLCVPKAVDAGETFPCRLETHGYNGNDCTHSTQTWGYANEIVFNINAHGLKLVEFGATEADTKALRWEIRSHDRIYAFDPKQNEDPETAYFNGMVLRVKRALQYLKSLRGWNGKELIASGNSQGGLQTIWAAGCGEGVTVANSGITWCCDVKMNDLRLAHKAATSGWYIPWARGLDYYDAVSWAKRIPATCQVNITRAGLGDYTCPPMGLAKLYNSVKGGKRITWVQGSRHGYVPPNYEGRDFLREFKGTGP